MQLRNGHDLFHPFNFSHYFSGFPVWGQLCRSCQGEELSTFFSGNILRGGIKIKNQENLGQCPNRGGG